MIKLTRLNGDEVVVNAEMIRFVESRPDTHVTLTSNDRLIVREPVAEVIKRAISYPVPSAPLPTVLGPLRLGRRRPQALINRETGLASIRALPSRTASREPHLRALPVSHSSPASNVETGGEWLKRRNGSRRNCLRTSFIRG